MDLVHILQLDRLGAFAHHHVPTIAYAMATSFVVIISGPMNSFFAKFAGNWHFVLRTLFYVLLFTVGYASLAYWSRDILQDFLGDQKGIPLMALTIGAFLGFGLWAGQRKNLK